MLKNNSTFKVEQWFGIPIYTFNNFNLVNEQAINKCISLCDRKTTYDLPCFISSNTHVLDSEPEFLEIKSFISNQLQNFVSEIYSIKQEVYITNSFVSLKKTNQGHPFHSHVNSFISGIFYLNCSEDDCLIFNHSPQIFNGATIINFEVKNYNCFNSGDVTYKVNNGDLFIFPSFLQHQVKPNKSDTPRICISFNTFFRGVFGEDEYAGNLTLL